MRRRCLGDLEGPGPSGGGWAPLKRQPFVKILCFDLDFISTKSPKSPKLPKLVCPHQIRNPPGRLLVPTKFFEKPERRRFIGYKARCTMHCHCQRLMVTPKIFPTCKSQTASSTTRSFLRMRPSSGNSSDGGEQDPKLGKMRMVSISK